jgi:NADH dehydrogenase/NADH:ubiquinone oxidoreductase subunit G
VKVAERDGKVVLVKARPNDHVNKEWLCDEGRYGFDRFQPEHRVARLLVQGESKAWSDLVPEWKKLNRKEPTLIALCPTLTLEDMQAIARLVADTFEDATVICNYAERALSDVQRVLISPDYAPNYRSFMWTFGSETERELQNQFETAMKNIQNFKQLVFFGDRSIDAQSITGGVEKLVRILRETRSWSFISDATSGLAQAGVTVPTRTVLERSGLYINRAGRLQYLDKVVPIFEASQPVWRICRDLAPKVSEVVGTGAADRDATNFILSNDGRFGGNSIRQIKGEGVAL